jgi:hypothetical protein
LPGLRWRSARSTALGGFYGAVLLAVGASLSGYFPLTVALVHWFQRLRARAISIMSLGMAMGGLAVPLVAWSMQPSAGAPRHWARASWRC